MAKIVCQKSKHWHRKWTLEGTESSAMGSQNFRRLRRAKSGFHYRGVFRYTYSERHPSPRQLGRAAECESEWSMDWVTQRRNTRHVGGRGGVLYTSKSVLWCPFHQGRSGAALGCKTDENVNFLRIYGIWGVPGGRGGW